ncbi:MAG: tetratricopeptide repeat protein [Candidatus Gottesmanbacteria bacterium]|nr:tetratricopeptide repeat protein [Candidatus Gottesmanbacteria bacterium]
MPTLATAEAAIAAALTNNWTEAIHINSTILKNSASDIAALNRLGYAYTQKGQRNLAKSTFEKVLKLDPYNQIAIKHMKLLGSAKHIKAVGAPGVTNQVSPLSFLEEPGITKVVAAVNPAPQDAIAHLTPGMEVALRPRKHCIEIRNMSTNAYIAALPDDISFRLLRLIASGNRYQALIKGLDKKTVIVMLREIVRSKKFAGQPSFTASLLPVSGGSHMTSSKDDTKPGQSLTDTDGDEQDGDTPNGEDPNEEDRAPRE